MSNTFFCRFCGCSNQTGSRFCRSCGRELTPPAAPVLMAPRRASPGAACPSCGTALRPGTQYCSFCGRSVPQTFHSGQASSQTFHSGQATPQFFSPSQTEPCRQTFFTGQTPSDWKTR